MGGCLVEDWPVGFPTLWDWWVYTIALAIASKTTMNSTMPPIIIVYRAHDRILNGNQYIVIHVYTIYTDCILHLQLLMLASQPQVLHICSVLRNNHAASCLTCYTTCMLIQISFKKCDRQSIKILYLLATNQMTFLWYPVGLYFLSSQPCPKAMKTCLSSDRARSRPCLILIQLVETAFAPATRGSWCAGRRMTRGLRW